MGIVAINTPLGKLFPSFYAGELRYLSWHQRNIKGSDLPDIFESLIETLNGYFADPHYPLDIPISAFGTAFQQRVWGILREIPVGRSVCYDSLAQRLNTSAQAIGQACKHNPISLFIPCHRVIKKNGTLGGYVGGQRAKAWLINHEKNIFK